MTDRPRRALVTGASSGIGAAIARAFGGQGWQVAVGARRVDKLSLVARDVEDSGGKVFAHALDVSKEDSVEAFFVAVEREFGPPDIVISNAGTNLPGLLHEVPPEDLRTEVETNLLGALLVANRALPGMLAQGRGDLVFISSLNVVLPRTFQVGYTATKAGVEAMARTLQMELEGTGVRSTIVRPGPTKTEFGYNWDPELIGRILDSWKHWGVLHHHQFLTPERIAEAVLTVVNAPPGTHLDVVQITPEAPARETD